MASEIGAIGSQAVNAAVQNGNGEKKPNGLFQALGLTEQQGEKLLQGLVMTAAGGAIGGKQGAGIGAVFALLNAMAGQDGGQAKNQQNPAGQKADENPQGPGQENLSILV